MVLGTLWRPLEGAVMGVWRMAPRTPSGVLLAALGARKEMHICRSEEVLGISEVVELCTDQATNNMLVFLQRGSHRAERPGQLWTKRVSGRTWGMSSLTVGSRDTKRFQGLECFHSIL